MQIDDLIKRCCIRNTSNHSETVSERRKKKMPEIDWSRIVDCNNEFPEDPQIWYIFDMCGMPLIILISKGRVSWQYRRGQGWSKERYPGCNYHATDSIKNKLFERGFLTSTKNIIAEYSLHEAGLKEISELFKNCRRVRFIHKNTKNI